MEEDKYDSRNEEKATATAYLSIEMPLLLLLLLLLLFISIYIERKPSSLAIEGRLHFLNLG